MPPYLLIHGDKDFNVPIEQSERMLEIMKKAGARCELIRVEGGGHGFGAWDKDPAMAGYRQLPASAPDFTLKDWAGKETRLSSLRGSDEFEALVGAE